MLKITHINGKPYEMPTSSLEAEFDARNPEPLPQRKCSVMCPPLRLHKFKGSIGRTVALVRSYLEEAQPDRDAISLGAVEAAAIIATPEYQEWVKSKIKGIDALVESGVTLPK